MPNIQFQFRRDTSANWTAYAPVLASGEMGIELDSNLFKIGDGVTDWAKLSYGGLSGVTGLPGDPGINGDPGPPTLFGNILRVDSINGNDSTAQVGELPYATINAALTIATTGQTVWVMPGTYNLSSSISIPEGVCLRGLNTQTCILQLLDVSSPTTLLTMGENCRVEDLTLKITSAEHHDITGIEYPGTSSQTSKLRTSVLTVDNSAASDIGTSNVTGIKFSGTGVFSESVFSFNSVKGSTVNVKSNGGGNKRGFLISGTNQVSTRDTNIYVQTPTSAPIGSSYVGIETADQNELGSIQLRSTSIAAPKQINTFTSSDILQTHPASLTNPTYLATPGIQIGPGTDLVTKSAGGKPFSTYIYPTTLFYGCRGVITSNKSGWLWPGTQTFSAGGGNTPPIYPDTSVPPARYRVQQPAIASGIMITANKGVTGDVTTVTLCKNATQAIIGSSNTPITVSLTDTNLFNSYYNSTVDFAAGDYISLFITTNSSTIEDVIVQLDMF